MGLVSGSSVRRLGGGRRRTFNLRGETNPPTARVARPKPTESAYRSRFYVTARHSADGNSYAPGEPIPEDEALRQGVIRKVPDPTGRPAWGHPCEHCSGTGKRAYKVASKHREGCVCPACSPCKHCNGTGEAAA